MIDAKAMNEALQDFLDAAGQIKVERNRAVEDAQGKCRATAKASSR